MRLSAVMLGYVVSSCFESLARFRRNPRNSHGTPPGWRLSRSADDPPVFGLRRPPMRASPLSRLPKGISPLSESGYPPCMKGDIPLDCEEGGFSSSPVVWLTTSGTTCASPRSRRQARCAGRPRQARVEADDRHAGFLLLCQRDRRLRDRSTRGHFASRFAVWG